jgi:hypothetical protein
MSNAPKKSFIETGRIISPPLLKPTMAGHSPEPTLHLYLFSFSFFLKPLSVTLPFAARFAGSEDSAPRAKAHQMLGGSGKRDSGERGWGDAGAIFAPASIVGAMSDGRAANGGVTAGENWMKKENLTSLPPAGPWFWPTRSLRKIAAGGHGVFPARGNFPQSPANQ